MHTSTLHVNRSEKGADIVVRNLLGIVVFTLLAVTLLPFAAPLLMRWGWEQPAHLLYTFFGYTCHQLPQRSWFLFGPKLTYSMSEIQTVWPGDTAEELRRFIGTPTMGWKVAWSDRMLSFYTMTAIWGALCWLLLRANVRLRPLRWRFVLLLLAPLLLDGFSHMLNDVMAGTSGTGFRDQNGWLSFITPGAWPAFYKGDELGTFNWWARLLTGALAAWALAFAFFPRFNQFLLDEAAHTRDTQHGETQSIGKSIASNNVEDSTN